MDLVSAGQDYVGSIINGKFPLRRWLGAGARSSVFETELESKPSRKVAIKLIPAECTDGADRLTLWAAVRDLHHPNLIEVFHAGCWELNGQPLLYVVTELADEVLGEILPGRPLEPDEVGQMMGPVLDALSALHANGLVHGHLKPSNILAVGDCLKLSADGICRIGDMVGSFGVGGVYEAPESSVGGVRPAADMWALGVTLVETLTQKLPAWSGDNGSKLMLSRKIPQPFDEIARECLRWDPASRCTLAGVRARLGVVESTPGPATQYVAIPEPVAIPVVAAKPPVVAPAVAPVVARKPSAPEPPRPAQPSPAQERARLPQSAAPMPLRPTGSSGLQKLALGALLVVVAGFGVWRLAEHRDAGSGVAQNDSSASQNQSGSAQDGVVHREMPQVPDFAMKTIRGTLRLGVRVHVDAQGDVIDAVSDPAGPSPYFAKFALEAAHQWKFRAPRQNGRPAASVWKLDFSFQQSGVEITPTRIEP